ncbi:unnamed protein product [Arctia plantaginis]|uniref:ATP-dependent DNA helicase n=1 Tax=Arctia plantaginis TaxID=874455 RepID=A0A8S0ZJK4_ARCPL|nr:unnamed protein product [Arctia plantaginis]
MRQANAAFSFILTKIGNGEVLEQFQLEIIESRFFKKEETRQLSPHGVRLFYTNVAVDSYNNSILDIITGTKNQEQEASFRLQLHKKSVIDTGGLPYQITFVKGKYYLITTNIDVSDGSVNGTVGKLILLDFNEDNVVCRVWLEFCGSAKVGQKARKKAALLAVQSKVNNAAVPIEWRTSNITMTRNKAVTVKRKHFPIISACAMTIHKSQGGTFDQIVYEYDKIHPQQLVYDALSRVTSIEGLFIVTFDDDETKFRFHHNRVQASSTISLVQEFQRLSLNKLETKAKSVIDFITTDKGISLCTFNVQSLRKHSVDLIDSVTEKTNILLLSETWLDNREECDIPNFNCITHFKRDFVRSVGVAIYHNINDTTNLVTPNMSVIMNNIRDLHVRRTSVADLCAAECVMENGVTLIMAVIYVSPNNKLIDIQEFIHRALLEYSKDVSRTLSRYNKNLDKVPLILAVRRIPLRRLIGDSNTYDQGVASPVCNDFNQGSGESISIPELRTARCEFAPSHSLPT